MTTFRDLLLLKAKFLPIWVINEIVDNIYDLSCLLNTQFLISIQYCQFSYNKYRLVTEGLITLQITKCDHEFDTSDEEDDLFVQWRRKKNYSIFLGAEGYKCFQQLSFVRNIDSLQVCWRADDKFLHIQFLFLRSEKLF